MVEMHRNVRKEPQHVIFRLKMVSHPVGSVFPTRWNVQTNTY